VLKEQGYIGKKVYVGIRPENLHDTEVDPLSSDFSVIKGVVEVAELMGSETYLYLNIAGQQVTARVDSHSRMRAGDTVELQFHWHKVHLFDMETEKAIR
ncbi:MAG: sugar transporter ATP-binding protein, partial [Clostridia bacterium]|nr:sugar transporter ATP-binding protein [Clostridia bacterium]